MSGPKSGESIKSWRAILLARDYQSLSLFRILISILIGCEFCINILPYYSTFYTDQGILPRAALLATPAGVGDFSVLMVSDYWLFHAAFVAAHILAVIAFGIGYRTRIANLVLFVTYTSLYWRNPEIITGADILVKLFLLWALFLPMARYWSVDAALDPGARHRPYPDIPFIGIKLQIATLYFFSAIYKFAGAPWWDGSAVSVALQDNIFGDTGPGLWAVHNLGGWLWLATYGIMIFQLLFSFMVYFPWFNNFMRAVALLGAACMHIGFYFLLRVGLFPAVCLIYLVLLVPDEWWNALLAKRRARLGRIRIFYDPDCEFCKKTALLFREFCLSFTVPVLPADRDSAALALLRQSNSWVVYDVEGQPLLRWRAVAYVLRQNPLFWIAGALTDLSFLRRSMEKLYDWIGDRRPLWGRLTRAALPVREQPAIGPLANGFCAFLILISLTYSFLDAHKPAIPLAWYQDATSQMSVKSPLLLTNLVSFLQVWQRWDIFAPEPSHWQRRYSFIGTRSEGSTLDLMNLWQPPLLVQDADTGALQFANYRWQKYFFYLESKPDYQSLPFTRYLCRRANRNVIAESGYVPAVHFEITRQPEDLPWRNDVEPLIRVSQTCRSPE